MRSPASLVLVVATLGVSIAGCGLAFEPRFFKEAGQLDDASQPIDGAAIADATDADSAAVVSDRVVPVEDAVVVGPDGGAIIDATGPRDAFVEPELDATLLDASRFDAVVRVEGGVVDSGVRLDTGVIVDSGVRSDTGVIVDSGVRMDSGSVSDGGGARVDGGSDGSTSCTTGQLFCGGTCVASDERNCGICGNACGAGLVCVAHRCEACPVGQMLCSDMMGNRCCALMCRASLMCIAVE